MVVSDKVAIILAGRPWLVDRWRFNQLPRIGVRALPREKAVPDIVEVGDVDDGGSLGIDARVESHAQILHVYCAWIRTGRAGPYNQAGGDEGETDWGQPRRRCALWRLLALAEVCGEGQLQPERATVGLVREDLDET